MALSVPARPAAMGEVSSSVAMVSFHRFRKPKTLITATISTI